VLPLLWLLPVLSAPFSLARTWSLEASSGAPRVLLHRFGLGTVSSAPPSVSRSVY